MAEKKEKQYVSDNVQLMAEWDWEKNNELGFNPQELTCGSNKKVWWKCEKGHTWDAVIAKRAAGRKCPICQGKKVLCGYNDLSTTHPHLVLEWDYKKNINVSPYQLSKGSEEKVWWICNRSHSWKASVYSRVAGSSCPMCSKELQTSFPEKIIYYYISKVFPDAIANYKTKYDTPFELDIYIPSLHLAIEYDGEQWHKDIQRDLAKNKMCEQFQITLIRVREPKCPMLDDNLSINISMKNKKVGISNAIKDIFAQISILTQTTYELDIDLSRDNIEILSLLDMSKKENNLVFSHPNIAKEWDYSKNGVLLPSNVSAGSDKKVWWICPLQHSYLASISSRIRGRGCPTCSGKIILKGYNDFATHNPELLQFWDYDKNAINPDSIAYGSDKKVWWLCENGHSYESSINNRRFGQACPICSNKKILVGFNDLSTTHPKVASEWNYDLNDITPKEVTAGSHQKVWWKCQKCGNEWQTYIYNRTSNHGCPKCARGRKEDGKV